MFGYQWGKTSGPWFPHPKKPMLWGLSAKGFGAVAKYFFWAAGIYIFLICYVWAFLGSNFWASVPPPKKADALGCQGTKGCGAAANFFPRNFTPLTRIFRTLQWDYFWDHPNKCKTCGPISWI